MSSFVNANQVRMWKTLVALSHVDQDLNHLEREFVTEMLSKSKLEAAEKAEILSGFDRADSAEKLFLEIQDARDRARLLYLARVMFYKDQEFSSYEQMALQHLESLHMKKFDLNALQPALSEVEQQVKARWANHQPSTFRARLLDLVDFWLY